MFQIIGKHALHYSIRQYGPSRLYREIFRITRKNIKSIDRRHHINQTVKFFLRNDKVSLDEVIQNKNIQYLMINARDDLTKSPAFSIFKPAQF